MDRLKNEAEHLRFGIRGGWLTVEQAVAWADGQIARSATPHLALLDVALARGRSREDVAALLDAVPGTADMLGVMRWCLADLLDVVEREPDATRDVAGWLETTAHTGLLPASEFGWEPLAFVEEFDLVEHSMVGTVTEVRQRLLAFLRRHGEREV